MTSPETPVVIVGAGCFGISTAYHLLHRGYRDVIVLDRSTILPAEDAASTDLNKIVRSAYNSTFYAKFAFEAIQDWKTEKWGDVYHESGVLVLGQGGASAYADAAYINDVAQGGRITSLPDPVSIRGTFPPGIEVASFEGVSGYSNKDSGWANSAKGVAVMIDAVIALGGKVLGGKPVDSLCRQGTNTTGVRCTDGTEYKGLVILAAGAWTSSSFPELDLGDRCLATGHCVAKIQLTSDEAAMYKDVPVVLDFSTGFYVFPPNENNIVKFALHDAGVTNTSSGAPVSVPRTVASHGTEGLRIPKSTLQFLRSSLKAVYPALATKPFTDTRMCWYTDSPDGDWMIGKFSPSDNGLILATAGSGHAYKFLPVIGGLVADLVQETLDPVLAARFAVDRKLAHIDESRLGFQLSELDLDELCTTKDIEGI